jgi:hypothetical protein
MYSILAESYLKSSVDINAFLGISRDFLGIYRAFATVSKRARNAASAWKLRGLLPFRHDSNPCENRVRKMQERRGSGATVIAAAPVDALVQAIKANAGTRITEIHMATDHGYSDHCIALEGSIPAWPAELRTP